MDSTTRQAEMAEMAEYRRVWKDGLKKKSLASLDAERERFEELVLRHPHRLAEDLKILQELTDRIESMEQKLIETARGDCPIAFYTPTWEQVQMMNAWHPSYEPEVAPNGYQSVCNFGGVRSLKTWATQMNTILWMVPNCEDWHIFQEHTDHLGRGKYRLYRKPQWDYWKRTGRMVYSEEEPPIVNKNIWHGCVDEDHWKNKLDRNYRRMMPMKWVKRVGKEYKWNISDKYFETIWDVRLSGKLYNSDVQSWSGEEVFLLNLDEGPPLDKLEEGVMRTRYIQWAYTPREAANVAERALIARDVYYGERNLVGQIKILMSKTGDVPDEIMPSEIKKIRLANAERMGEAGRVTVEGGFFDSSPAVFSAFKRERHVLPVTGADVIDAINGKAIHGKPWMEAFRDANIIRGFDEGLAHPTACVWVALLASGELVIFKEYLESNASIGERCDKIIQLSGNTRVEIDSVGGNLSTTEQEIIATYGDALIADRQRERNTGERIRRYREKMDGMFIRKTFSDSKIFRRDPKYPLEDWTINYSREGLKLEKATNAAPEARCDFTNGLFRTDMTRQHLNPAQRTPENPYGSLLYVTMDCDKVVKKLERYLWEQFTGGPRRGEPTGKPDRKDDDLIDAVTYATNGKLRWQDPNELKARRAA